MADQKLQSCPFCNRNGLPILPVRYAIARTDLASAADLPDSFIPKGNDLATKKGNDFAKDVRNIALPHGIAKYTLRLLRPGYLYMYDEHRKEWSGYVVNTQSYLGKFFEVPDRALESKNFRVTYPTWDPAVAIDWHTEPNCRGKNFPYILRCVNVQDPAYATTIWLGFSEAPWTTAVLKNHADASYRAAHMQHIDVAAWRDGGNHPYMLPFGALHSVAEFRANRDALQTQTRKYLQPFLPKIPVVTQVKGDPGGDLPAPGMYRTDKGSYISGYDPGTPEALMTARNKALREKMPPQFQCLLPDAIPPAPAPIARKDSRGQTHNVPPPPPRNPVKTAAWAFSPFDPWLVAQEETDKMSAWGKQLEVGYRKKTETAHLRPAIASVPDPAGIVQELNGLAMYRGVELLENIDWQWQFQTVSAIELVHQGVLNGLLEQYIQAMMTRIPPKPQHNTGLNNPGTSTIPSKSPVLSLDWTTLPFSITDAEKEEWKKQYGEQTWKRDYYSLIDNPKYTDFKNKYPNDIRNEAEKRVSQPDRAYIAWFSSPSFKAYFTHNFDPANLTSGISYAQVVHNCIVEAAGREHSMAYFKQALNQTNPDEAIHILTRALVLNQDSLARKVKAIADANAKGPEVNLRDLGEKTFQALQETFIAGSAYQRALQNSSKLEMPLYGVNRLLYQLLGPITWHMGEMLNRSIAAGLRKTAPQSWLVSLMAGAMHAQNPGAQLVYLTDKMSSIDAARLLTDAIIERYGGSQKKLRSTVERQIKAASKEERLFRGLFVVEPASRGPNNRPPTNAQRVASASPVPAEDFRVHIKTSVSEFLDPEFKGNIFSLIFSGASVLCMIRELHKENSPIAKTQLGASLLALAADATEALGRTMRKVPSFAEGLQNQVEMVIAREFEHGFNGRWLLGASRVLGVAGGLIAGFADIIAGVQAFPGNPAYGGGLILLGSAEMVVACMLLVEGMATTNLILGLIIAVGMAALTWFMNNPPQDWLTKCKFGKSPTFRSLEEQQGALNKLLGAH